MFAPPLPIPKGTVAQRIREVGDRVAPAEAAVVAHLLDNYPMAGLMPVAQLAENAGVSAPTVLRLVGKLGYPGYAAFQKALRTEVSNRLFSPIDVYGEKGSKTKSANAGNLLAQAQAVFVDGLRSTFAHLDPNDLTQVVNLLADRQRRIIILGGRFSAVLAAHLSTYLTMLRPHVQLVGPHAGAQMASLIDIDKHTIVVVFDYRPYQRSTIDWSIEAIKRGGHLVLLTDQYRSPLATHAASLLCNSTTGLGPFDSMSSGFALVELVISMLARKLGKAAQVRLTAFEAQQLREESPIR